MRCAAVSVHTDTLPFESQRAHTHTVYTLQQLDGHYALHVDITHKNAATHDDTRRRRRKRNVIRVAQRFGITKINVHSISRRLYYVALAYNITYSRERDNTASTECGGPASVFHPRGVLIPRRTRGALTNMFINYITYAGEVGPPPTLIRVQTHTRNGLETGSAKSRHTFRPVAGTRV